MFAAAASLTLTLTAAACGNNDTTAESATTTTTTTVQSGQVDVVAVDYKFVDLPATVRVGTKFTLSNESQKELHELVAVKLPDSETRSVQELLALPEDQLEAQLGPVEPAMVLIRPPGAGEEITAVGDGTFTEAGRYAIICSIPVGVDPAAFMAAAEAATDGPPQVPGAGPPHFTEGMYGEITVEK